MAISATRFAFLSEETNLPTADLLSQSSRDILNAEIYSDNIPPFDPFNLFGGSNGLNDLFGEIFDFGSFFDLFGNLDLDNLDPSKFSSLTNQLLNDLIGSLTGGDYSKQAEITSLLKSCGMDLSGLIGTILSNMYNLRNQIGLDKIGIPGLGCDTSLLSSSLGKLTGTEYDFGDNSVNTASQSTQLFLLAMKNMNIGNKPILNPGGDNDDNDDNPTTKPTPTKKGCLESTSSNHCFKLVGTINSGDLKNFTLVYKKTALVCKANILGFNGIASANTMQVTVRCSKEIDITFYTCANNTSQEFFKLVLDKTFTIPANTPWSISVNISNNLLKNISEDELAAMTWTGSIQCKVDSTEINTYYKLIDYSIYDNKNTLIASPYLDSNNVTHSEITNEYKTKLTQLLQTKRVDKNLTFNSIITTKPNISCSLDTYSTFDTTTKKIINEGNLNNARFLFNAIHNKQLVEFIDKAPNMPYTPDVKIILTKNDLDFYFLNEIDGSSGSKIKLSFELNLLDFFDKKADHIPIALATKTVSPNPIHCGDIIRRNKKIFTHGIGFLIDHKSNIILEEWNGTTSPFIRILNNHSGAGFNRRVNKIINVYIEASTINKNMRIEIKNTTGTLLFSHTVSDKGVVASSEYNVCFGGIGAGFVSTSQTNCREKASAGIAANASYGLRNIVFVHE